MRFFVSIVMIAVGLSLKAQTNLGKLDGSITLGIAIPAGDHKNTTSQIPRSPLQFGNPGEMVRFDCHVGLSNGWKVGFVMTACDARINAGGLADYFLTQIDTAGYYIKQNPQESGFYESMVWGLQVANDIRIGKLIVTPHASLGITSLRMKYFCNYDLKQRGTNYYRTTDVSAIETSAINAVYSYGLKLGMEWKNSFGTFELFALIDRMSYQTEIGFSVKTKDIFDTSISNQLWSQGEIKYTNLGFGAVYFLP